MGTHPGLTTDADPVDLAREVTEMLLIESHLSGAKYTYVTRSIWCLAGSGLFGFLYLLTSQF